ncbi:hypothetical protein GGR56DRAFT_669039 [Xylariaceae sp. FL0804]|nr:hypothetical protein GGR56DRAFT_669039 [Xylariaceae sp. FL0804]
MDLGTVGTVVEVVNKAVAIYQRIQDVPDELDRVGRRVKRLQGGLRGLELYLRGRPKTAFAHLRSAQEEELKDIIGETRTNCGKALGILDRWERRALPLGLQFRGNALARLAQQAYFALGMQQLADYLEDDRAAIDSYVSVLGLLAHDAAAAAAPAAPPAALGPPPPTTPTPAPPDAEAGSTGPAAPRLPHRLRLAHRHDALGWLLHARAR